MSTEITTTEKVQAIVDNSGVELELDLTKLANLADRGKAIESVDDENFLAVKKEMQKTRKILVEFFKEARDGFNKQAKGIIQVQNIVLEEFTPEEERLIALDKAEKERVMKEERAEALPAKRERITESGIEFTDEEILDMDDAEFEIEYNVRLGEKLEADRVADQERRDAEAKKLEAEKAEVQRQKDEADRVEKARVEERERAEKALRITKETAKREEKARVERIAREALKKRKESESRINEQNRKRMNELIDMGLSFSPGEGVYLMDDINVSLVELKTDDSGTWAIKVLKISTEILRRKEEAEKEQAEKDRLANEKYQAFLKENEYDEETDLIIEGKIYRLVAEFKE